MQFGGVRHRELGAVFVGFFGAKEVLPVFLSALRVPVVSLPAFATSRSLWLYSSEAWQTSVLKWIRCSSYILNSFSCIYFLPIHLAFCLLGLLLLLDLLHYPFALLLLLLTLALFFSVVLAVKIVEPRNVLARLRVRVENRFSCSLHF